MGRRSTRPSRLDRMKDRGQLSGASGKNLMQLGLMVLVLFMLLAFWGQLSKGAASCYANLAPKKTVEPVSAPGVP